MIRLEQVNVSYGRRAVLKDINLHIPEGQTTVVMGESGSGKTSLLKLITGLLKPHTGQIYINGVEIGKASRQVLTKIRRSMAMVFQNGALFDSLKVWENIGLPLHQQRELSLQEIRCEVERALESLGLAGAADMMPSELSGGMKMRVAIARAMITRPRILLYDEPTSSLDPITTATVCDVILDLERESNVTSVVVTHDLGTALRVGTNFVMFRHGQIVFRGCAEDLLSAEEPYVREFVDKNLEIEKPKRWLSRPGSFLPSPGRLSDRACSLA